MSDKTRRVNNAGRTPEPVVKRAKPFGKDDRAARESQLICTLFSDTQTRGRACRIEPSEERKAPAMGTNPATKYTDEFRRETADCIISSGRPIAERCRELGLSSKAVNRWVVERRRELSGEPDPAAEDRELREARKRIRELEQENDFLKKAAAFFAKDQA